MQEAGPLGNPWALKSGSSSTAVFLQGFQLHGRGSAGHEQVGGWWVISRKGREAKGRGERAGQSPCQGPGLSAG